MSKYFYCRECKQRVRRNPCLKAGQQRYCGKRECQQARKNHWELQKKRHDPDYRQRRKEQHKKWLQNNPGHSYQACYRKNRPSYTAKNRKYQQARNLVLRQIALGVDVRKIVKTDALTSVRPVQCGLYEIRPCKVRRAKKIVKTDALFAIISVCQGIPGDLVADCKDGRA